MQLESDILNNSYSISFWRSFEVRYTCFAFEPNFKSRSLYFNGLVIFASNSSPLGVIGAFLIMLPKANDEAKSRDKID